MDNSTLGRSGIAVSRLILGCGNFGGIGSAPAFFGRGTAKAEAFMIMDAAWDAGITTFDTADAYGGGRSETYIGEWLATKSPAVAESLVIATKTFNPMDDRADCGLRPERIARQLESSLRRLGVERVAMYLAHEFDPTVPLAETQGAFEILQRAGKVAAFGASNFSDTQLRDALASAAQHQQPRYEWVQNSFSLLEQGERATILAQCRDQGLGYTPFSPLAGGWLTGKYGRDQPIPANSRMSMRPEPYEGYRDRRVFDALDVLRRVSTELGRSMASVALSWLLAQPGVTAIVIGPNTVAHLAPILDSVDAKLTPQTVDLLTQTFVDARSSAALPETESR